MCVNIRLMAALRSRILVILLAVDLLDLSRAGTRMLEPPSRASLWRYGYNTPRNNWDDMTDCGGYEKHYVKNGGTCGVCGDPSDEPTPRKHEAGGELAPSPTPVRAFEKGSYITVVMETSASLFGQFEFRLCNISHDMETPGQSCFDQTRLNILESELGTEYQIGSRQGIHVLNLQLPTSLACRHCILQWTHKTGFTTNQESCLTCPGGESKCRACKGCGNQVWYVGCTDITIYNNTASPPVGTTPTPPPDVVSKPRAPSNPAPPPSNPTPPPSTPATSATTSPNQCVCPHPDPIDNLINSPTSYTGHFSGSTRLPDTAIVSNNSNNGVTNTMNNRNIINNNNNQKTTKHDVVYSPRNYNFMKESKNNLSIEGAGGGNESRLTTQTELHQKVATVSPVWPGLVTTQIVKIATSDKQKTEGRRTRRLKQTGGRLKGRQHSGVRTRLTQIAGRGRVVTTLPSPQTLSSTMTTHTTVSPSPQTLSSTMTTHTTVSPSPQTLSSTMTTHTTVSPSSSLHGDPSLGSDQHTTVSPHNTTHESKQHHTTKSPHIKTHTSTQTLIATSKSKQTTTTTTGNKLTRPGITNRTNIFCYITNRSRNPQINFDLWCNRNCPGKGIFTCLYHVCKLTLCPRDPHIRDSLRLRSLNSGIPQQIYSKQATINKSSDLFLNRVGENVDAFNRFIINTSYRIITSEGNSPRQANVNRRHWQISQQQQQQYEILSNTPPDTAQTSMSLFSAQNNRNHYISNTRNYNNGNWMSLWPFLLREGMEI